MHAVLVVAIQLVLTSVIAAWHLCLLALIRKHAPRARPLGFPVLAVLHSAAITWVSFRTIPDCITLAILLVGYCLTRTCKVVACSIYFDEIMDAHGSLGRAAFATLLDTLAPGMLVPSVARKQRIHSWHDFLEPAPPLRHQLRQSLVSYWIYDLLLEAAVTLSHTATTSGALDRFIPGSTVLQVLSKDTGATAKLDMASVGLIEAASAAIGFAQIFQFIAFHRIICFAVSIIYTAVQKLVGHHSLPDLYLPVFPIQSPWLSASLSELWGKRWHKFFKADYMACAYMPVQRLGLTLCTAKHSRALPHGNGKSETPSVPGHSKVSKEQEHHHYQQQQQQQQQHKQQHKQQQCYGTGGVADADASAKISLHEGACTTAECVSPPQRAVINTCAVLSCFLMSGLLHETMNAASFGTHATTAGLQLCFFMLNGVGTVAERPLEAWGRAMGLRLPRSLQVLTTVTFMVSLGPLFAIPWIQAGYPQQMLRPVRVIRTLLDFLQIRGMVPLTSFNA